jgi:hypothetical protein
VTAPLPWLRDDGGRAAAGYRGLAGDCACRAIAIAAGMDYRQAYDLINAAAEDEPRSRRRKPSSAREGVHTSLMRLVMRELGWDWRSLMGIGTGCTVHLAAGELPGGRLVTALSRHYAAVIDGTVHDTYDPCRDGTRCVYGYFTPPRARRRRLTKCRAKSSGSRPSRSAATAIMAAVSAGTRSAVMMS